MIRTLLATIAVAVICMPAVAFAQDEEDEEVLLTLIQGLQAQIDAIQLIPGPPGTAGPAGATGPAGPPGIGGGDRLFEYVGITSAILPGDAGVGEFSRACDATFIGSRMCTSEEVIKTINPPRVSGVFAWVHPVLVVTGAGGDLADYSGVSTFGSFGQLSCNGWSQLVGTTGLVLDGSKGSFSNQLCSSIQSAGVACCAPPALP